MSAKKKRTIGPYRGVTWLYRCGHGIFSLPFISILAFIPFFFQVIIKIQKIIYLQFKPEPLRNIN